MSAPKYTAPTYTGKPVKKSNPYPLSKMAQPLLTYYIDAIIVLFPLIMNQTKYSAITLCKLNTFRFMFCFAAVFLLLSFILYEATKVVPERVITREDALRPTLYADAALGAYWVLMLFSSLLAFSPSLAFSGMTPRNNGFIIQSMYILTYFALAHGLKPQLKHALVFPVGGGIFGLLCILHFFGVDIYKIASVNGASYGGPFWNDTKYRFLGPMGNVNLGSYLLAVTAIISAGLFIQGIKPKLDNYGILNPVCFAVILFAELNINTDAGLVALAAAVLLIPLVLCRSFGQLLRTLFIFDLAAVVLLANELIVEIILRGEEADTKFELLIIGTIGLSAVLFLLVYFRNRLAETALGRADGKAYRNAAAVCISLAVIAGLGAALYITQPDPMPAGSIAGAVEIVDTYENWEKSETVLHEFGQLLRGNFDDDFGHNRLFTWKRSLRLLELRPLLGIGPDNFKSVFAYYFGDEAADQFPASSGGVDKAHNEFLDVLVDNGILGFAAYMTFFGFLLYYAFRNAERKKYSPVFGVAIAGYMAHAFFGYQLPIQSPCMWVMLGVAGAMIRAEEKETEII